MVRQHRVPRLAVGLIWHLVCTGDERSKVCAARVRVAVDVASDELCAYVILSQTQISRIAAMTSQLGEHTDERAPSGL